MPVQLPEGLSASSLITAKGAELKFWVVKTNEAADKKVLNVSGTVETLRGNLASYYGLDLTINPRTAAVTAPTVNEDIRDRQWADLAAMGVEWREKVRAGLPFRLLSPDQHADSDHPHPILSTTSESTSSQKHRTPTRSSLPQGTNSAVSHTTTLVQRDPGSNHLPTSAVTLPSAAGPSTALPSSTSTVPPRVSHPEAAVLDDLSTVVAGLERCQGLQAIIQQIESGAVQAIRDRYGPSKPGHRGTADPSWPRYSNLVSKRERLYRILIQDFGGNKERFFNFFSVPPPVAKKRKRADDEPTTVEDHYRSFRKIVEAVPWCEADLATERRNNQYLGADGNFSEDLWKGRWKTSNGWEVWREIGRERYVKEK
ncbi:hypothetical protein C8R46DRAFT_1357612 [Mycena filopes]|nr:hypothetical protein C8R46DRAFT_1361891 [Mycena filopes]KAJ7147251.1 hypothetical protein C8R46DRAFT_1359784 [Mycena filopes]KAJ7152002.1 hypothetical protein C8R46DRAFT_1357612 [Mycena filopes]